MKKYIPPKDRSFFTSGSQKARISFVGIFITFCFFLSLISLVSFFQSNLSKVQAKVTAHSYKAAEISDAISSSNKVVNTNLQTNVQVTNLPFVLANLPLERVWPIRGPITTYFSSYHQGLDIAASYGTPIHPWSSGIVTVVSFTANGFGRYIVIRHNDGYESTYAHLSGAQVGVGQEVSSNDVIGTVGSTGRATGPHLHFQLAKDGWIFNPLLALP